MRGVRPDALHRERSQQFVEQQRVARRRRLTGGGKRVVQIATEPLDDEPRGRPSTERARPHRHAQRITPDLIQGRGIGPLGGPQRPHQEHGQPLQPPHQVGQKAQRGRVGPVQVIDSDRQRALAGSIDGQPIQSVQRRERHVVRDVRGPGNRERKHLSHRGRRPGEQRLPRPYHHRLEQLANDPERELALELPPRALSTRSPA